MDATTPPMRSPVSSTALVLQVLTDGEANGTEVLARIERLSGRRYHDGATYSALSRALRDGLVTVREGPVGTRGGRRPKIYTLTPAGWRLANLSRRMILRIFCRGRSRLFEALEAMREKEELLKQMNPAAYFVRSVEDITTVDNGNGTYTHTGGSHEPAS